MLCTPNQSKFTPVQIGNNENTFNWANLSPDKQELFIKCVLIIQYLSDEAVEEANEDLKRIINFYSEDLSNNYQTFLSTPQRTIKAKILPSKIRPSLVLDDF
jgi:hypothetical protein